MLTRTGAVISFLGLGLATAACSSSNGDHGDADAGTSQVDVDAGHDVDAAHAAAHGPILFVHGINGDADGFASIKARFVADGWSADELFAYTFDDPSWGCNVDNASDVGAWVDQILAATGASKVDIVAHSMGTLSSRYFIKDLGGTAKVAHYVTLGGMHHGLSSSCAAMFPGAPCVWTELCESGDFIGELNADPATPGELFWVSIFGTADTSVPNDSSRLTGAENIEMPDVDHEGLLEDVATYEQIKRVLAY